MTGSGQETPRDIFRDTEHNPTYDEVHGRVFARCVRMVAAAIHRRGQGLHLSVADDQGFVTSLLAYCAGFGPDRQPATSRRMPRSEEHFFRRFGRVLTWRLNDRQRVPRVKARMQRPAAAVEDLECSDTETDTEFAARSTDTPTTPDALVRDWVNGIGDGTLALPPRRTRLKTAAAYVLHVRAGVPIRQVAEILHLDPSTVHRRLDRLPEGCRDVPANVRGDEPDELMLGYARRSIRRAGSEKTRCMQTVIVYALWRADVPMNEIAAVLRCHRATVYRLRRRIALIGGNE